MNELGPDAGDARLPWGPLSADDRATARELAEQLRPAIAEAKRELVEHR
jgi:hypothetical protein